MLYRLMYRAALSLVLTALLVMPAQSQADNLTKVFAPVDVALRQRLAERLRLYVEYERTHQWDKLYDLTSKQYLENDSREEFVKRQRFFSGDGFSDTLGFIPQSTVTSYYGIEGNYSIEGCMKVRWKGRIHYWHAGVDAYWEDGDWYFSTISTITGIDAPPRPCARKQKAGKVRG
jgi:hypothetical protein